MKNLLLLLVIFLSVSLNEALAQTAANGKINGRVVNSSNNNPIDFATVALVDHTGKSVKSAQTDTKGGFNFNNLQFGSYTVKISFVGYQIFTSTIIKLSESDHTERLGLIKLIPSEATVLKEVVVQAERSPIQLGVDRKVFNVEQSLVSEGGSATDLLTNVPTVSVDIDGNVSLRGSSSVRVLIDGKPSAIGGGDIATVLQALPASSIENIELITNPSAKYDPEGQTGIINIVLKKNKKIGLNGAVSLSAGTLDNYNASTNLNYRDKKVNLYGNYSFRTGTRVGGGFNNTIFSNTEGIINNNSDGLRANTGNTAKLGMDYYLNDKTTLGVSGNINFRDSDRDDDINYWYQNYDSDLDGTSFRSSRENDKDTGYDLSLDFTKKFKKQGEELVANLSFGRSGEEEDQRLNQNFYTFAGALKDTVDIRNNDSEELSKNYNFQLDYTLPISKTQKFETGYRGTIRRENASQVSNLYDLSTKGMRTDYSQSNDFNLEDIVHAVYGSYQNQLTGNFGVQVGLRAEQAYLRTEYISLDPVNPSREKGNLDYLRVYPSVFLTQKLPQEQQLQLSYTRRVNRPRGWQVNPFRDLSDPNNIHMGNPGLKPEDIHSFEFSYMKYLKGLTLTSSLYLRQVNDVVQGVQSLIETPNTNTTTTTLTQFINLTKNQATGFELIARADLSKTFNITGNVNIYHNKFFGSEEYNIGSNSGYNWTSNLTTSFKLPYNLSAQLNGNYMAPRVMAQGKSKAMWGTDAALKLDVLNKKGSISFNMRDVLDSRKWGMFTETNLFYRESQRRMQGRMTTLTFSYRFGKSDLPQRRKRDNSGNEGNQMPEEGF